MSAREAGIASSALTRPGGAGEADGAPDRIDTTTFLPPGSTLGVVGGGQLGRMFAHAAQRGGYRVVVLDPDEASPAGTIAHEHVRAGYLDPVGLERLAAVAAAVTTEFENVPAEALATLARTRPVAPGAEAVAICQDRAAEKAAFARAGVACAPFAVLGSSADLDGVAAALLPGILKTARLGYDGKGQRRVEDRAALARAFAELGGVPCVLEQRLALVAEISVIVARSARGEIVALPVQENIHRDGILALTRVPAQAVDAAGQAEAVAIARRVAEAIGYVGVLCVELFVLAGGALVANEMAPRPHNSGHYSIDACDLSQFDLQVRAMTDAPLVAPRQHSPAVMLNLLGDLWLRGEPQMPVEPPWERVLALPGAHLHLYGKREARAGRKMGHLTLTAVTAAAAESRARSAAAILGLEGW